VTLVAAIVAPESHAIKALSPFQRAPSARNSVKGFSTFTLDAEVLSVLEGLDIGSSVQLVLPTEDGHVVHMERFDVLDENTAVIVVDVDGEHAIDRPLGGVHLKGSSIEPGAFFAHISISSTSGAYGIFSSNNDTWTITNPPVKKTKNGGPQEVTVLRGSSVPAPSAKELHLQRLQGIEEDNILRQTHEDELRIRQTHEEGAGTTATSARSGYLSMGIDADHTFYEMKGRTGSGTIFYIESLLAGMSQIYAGAGIPVYPSYIRIWTVDDPWNGKNATDTRELLDAYAAWYHANPNQQEIVNDRDDAQLLVRKPSPSPPPLPPSLPPKACCPNQLISLFV
jgi:hypothetical protein